MGINARRSGFLLLLGYIFLGMFLCLLLLLSILTYQYDEVEAISENA